MNKIKNSMLFQMIAGAIILILLIVLFAKFDNTEIQDNSNKNNTINNEVENIQDKKGLFLFIKNLFID